MQSSLTALWLNENYQSPVQGSVKSKWKDINVLTPKEFLTRYSNANGLVYFEFDYGDFGTGHVDYWFGGLTGTPGSRWYATHPEDYGGVKVWFWPLK